MSITGWLRRQHAAMRKALDRIESALKGESPLGSVRLRHELERLVPLLRAHEKIEDSLLFTELERLSGLPGGVVELFRNSHTDVQGKLRALDEILALRDAPISRFVAGINFVSALREHMEQEEATLFPIAQTHLAPELQERLGREAQARAKRRPGAPGALPAARRA